MSFLADLSVEKDECMICHRNCEKYGRHEIEHPASQRGGLVCTDCRDVLVVQCACCRKGNSVERVIYPFIYD